MHILYTNWYTGIYIYTNTICLYAYLAIVAFCLGPRSWNPVPFCQELGADVDRRFADLQAAAEAVLGDAADIDVLDHGMLWLMTYHCMIIWYNMVDGCSPIFKGEFLGV